MYYSFHIFRVTDILRSCWLTGMSLLEVWVELPTSYLTKYWFEMWLSLLYYGVTKHPDAVLEDAKFLWLKFTPKSTVPSAALYCHIANTASLVDGYFNSVNFTIAKKLHSVYVSIKLMYLLLSVVLVTWAGKILLGSLLGYIWALNI